MTLSQRSRVRSIGCMARSLPLASRKAMEAQQCLRTGRILPSARFRRIVEGMSLWLSVSLTFWDLT